MNLLFPRWIIVLALILAFSFPLLRAEELADEVEALTGQHTRLVWTAVAEEGVEDKDGVGSGHLLLGFDSQDGDGIRPILKEEGNYRSPLLSGDGNLVLFSTRSVSGADADESLGIEIVVRAVRFSGGFATQLGNGYAVDVVTDSETEVEWVYALDDFSTDSSGSVVADSLIRFPLNAPERRESVWSGRPLPLQAVSVSDDTKAIFASLPERKIARFDVASGAWSDAFDGLAATVSPGADDGALVLTSDGLGGQMISNTVPVGPVLGLDQAMRKGWSVRHLRFSNRSEIMVLTGPYRQGVNAASEVCIGRLSEDRSSVTNWVQLTEDIRADYSPDIWVGEVVSKKAKPVVPSQPVAPTPTRSAPTSLENRLAGLGLGAPKELRMPAPSSPVQQPALPIPWPVVKSPGGILWENGFKDSFRTGQFVAMGRARYGRFGEMLPSGGAFVADETTAAAMNKTMRKGGEFTVELVISGPSSKEPQTILRGEDFFMIYAENRMFFLEINDDNGGTYKGFCVVDASRGARSLVYVRAGDQEMWYVDGRPAYQAVKKVRTPGLELSSDFKTFIAGHVGVERIGIHAGIFGKREIVAIEASTANAVGGRRPVKLTKVKGELLAVSAPPPAGSLGSTRRVLMNHHYRVVEQAGEEPSLLNQEISVLHWVILDRQMALGFPLTVGVSYDLSLEPREAHPELAAEMIRDDIGIASLPSYLDVGSARSTATTFRPPPLIPQAASGSSKSGGLQSTIQSVRQSRAKAATTMGQRAAIIDLERRMKAAAAALQFEEAARLRDEMIRIKTGSTQQ